ncbi:MFS transporter, partial [Paraburkholderia sp. SIMBA_009]
AALLLTLISFHWLFLGNAIGFIASGLLVLSVALPVAKTVQRPFLERLTRGSRIYFATPRLRGLLALSFASSAAGAMVIVNT